MFVCGASAPAVPVATEYCVPAGSYLVPVPAVAEPIVSVQVVQMAATSATILHEPPHVFCVQQPPWAQLPEVYSPMHGSPVLGLSPVLRSPMPAPSPTQRPLHRQQQQQQAVPACNQALTRGARRRVQQRLRKKMGRLERALSGAVSQAKLPEQEPADSSYEVEKPPLCANTSREVEDCPMLVVDKAAQLPELGDLRAVCNLGDEKIVPICAIQNVPRLEDMPDIETMDTFVKLPYATRGAKADSDSQPQALGIPRCSTMHLPQCKTWLGQAKIEIPTANTFVHFHVGSAQPKRRSRSV